MLGCVDISAYSGFDASITLHCDRRCVTKWMAIVACVIVAHGYSYIHSMPAHFTLMTRPVLIWFVHVDLNAARNVCIKTWIRHSRELWHTHHTRMADDYQSFNSFCWLFHIIIITIIINSIFFWNYISTSMIFCCLCVFFWA